LDYLVFFYLIPLPYIFTGPASNKVFAAVMAVICFVYYAIAFRKFKFGKFGGWIISLYLILLISGISSIFNYEFKATSVLWECLTFFILLMYFPIVEYLKSVERIERLIQISELILSILAILFIIQYFLYNRGGLDVVFLQLDGIITDTYILRPYLPLRIYSVFEGTSRIFVLIAAYRCIKKKFKHCKIDFITLLLLLAAIVLIDQSRTYLLTILFGIIVIVFVEYKKYISIRQVFMYFLGVIAGIGFSVSKITSIFYTVSENEGSVWARLDALKYYMGVIQEHYFWGLGITIPEKTSVWYKYIKGTEGYYNYDDIGIAGVFFSLGIVGLIWYLLLFVYFIRIVSMTKHNKALSVAALVVFLFSSLLMSYIDKARLMSLMITMILVEVNYNWGKIAEKTGWRK
jgi:hypothetical protein